MGQLVSFFQDIQLFFQEALNVALAVVTVLAIIKGLVNLWKSGLFQFLFFLILAGRSCSFRIGHHTTFESVTMSVGGVFHELPALCRINNSHSLIQLSHNSSLALSVEYVDLCVVLESDQYLVAGDYSNCTGEATGYNWVIDWTLKGLGHGLEGDPKLHCQPKRSTNAEFTLQLNISRRHTNDHYRERIETGIRHMFGPFKILTKEGKDCVILRNTTWKEQCVKSHYNTLAFLLKNTANSLPKRRPLAFFSWSLSDSSGNDMPGGYCLEEWMLIAAKLKCFGNTALAKCNLNHDSEFCDMLKLYEFNKNAISKLNNQTREAVNALTHSINSLISDDLLMKNKLREFLKVPYCNYTKFWYVNHTKSGEHSLPKCWLVNNGSFLNESEFRNEWILESDHLIAEILSKEYQDRQGKTPITLVDMCFWSAIFFDNKSLLHLVGFPTHRHIVGEACPLPHKINRHGACACGLYQKLKKKTAWRKRHQ
ncbi:glycoprotein precursor [Amapari virus]|uniref:Pre-glycoprotein polyprotein GP complex n=1 Tax=Amapari virus TaxID=2886894 RepID=Q8B122_AMAVB|nr:glycoprotein precursor [Amapari virus]AAN09934.1 glycoprotein precursor [Amapari virus]